jgi:hypothetical protein
MHNTSRELNETDHYQRILLRDIQVDIGRLVSVFPGSSGIQLESTSPEEPHAQNYTPPYLAFMLQACQQLGLSANRRLTKQEIEAWIRKSWPRDLGQLSNTKVEYMSTFLRHPEDEKGGHYRPMRKT